jgi:hypothetical protein
MADTGTAYFDRVRRDHYLHLAALWGAGLYAWQVHSFWIGLGTIAALYVIVGATNTFIMFRESDDAFKWMRLNRWGWVLLAWVGLVISASE